MNFADFWVASSQHVAIKYMLVRPPQLFSSGGYKALKMVQIRSPIPIYFLSTKSKKFLNQNLDEKEINK